MVLEVASVVLVKDTVPTSVELPVTDNVEPIATAPVNVLAPVALNVVATDKDVPIHTLFATPNPPEIITAPVVGDVESVVSVQLTVD